MRIYYLLFIILFSLMLSSCRQEKIDKTRDDFSVDVRIKRDPSFLFPSKSMGTIESEINQYLYLPLANYDPFSLEMIPILLKELPEAVEVKEGPFKGTLKFDCTLKKDAKWDNGKAITAYDYLFSIKIYKLEDLKINPAVRSVFQQLVDVEPDSNDPLKFSVYVNKDFHLARELVLITEVMPEYIYDSTLILRDLPLEDGIVKNIYEEGSESFKQFNETIGFLNHSDCGRKVIVSSGPYFVEDWQSNQKVSLKRKSTYWGKNYPDNPYLSANPEYIIFNVIPDDNTALTALRNNSIDVYKNVNGSNFERFHKDEKIKNKFTFHSPAQLRYYLIGINNHAPFLKDRNVRKALAHLMDVDKFIANQEQGYGVRVPGPIVPSRSYFNDTISPPLFDPEKAKSLLAESGWIDRDKDGVVDKIMAGKKEDLSIDILISGSSLGKNLSLTLKEKARLAGVEINITTKEAQLIKKEIAQRNFDLYPKGYTYGAYPEDLYQVWHSSNDFPGGSNIFGINNKDIDELIEKIRKSDNKDETAHYYKKIQEVFHQEQASIFLYAPSNNIIVNKGLEAKVSTMKNAYVLNLFEQADEHSKVR